MLAARCGSSAGWRAVQLLTALLVLSCWSMRDRVVDARQATFNSLYIARESGMLRASPRRSAGLAGQRRGFKQRATAATSSPRK